MKCLVTLISLIGDCVALRKCMMHPLNHLMLYSQLVRGHQKSAAIDIYIRTFLETLQHENKMLKYRNPRILNHFILVALPSVEFKMSNKFCPFQSQTFCPFPKLGYMCP